MASFLDRQPAQFNPYIPTKPIQTYEYVAEQLQQKYDQGVEKVQNYYTAATQLPVVRDVDKQYLQAKTTNLATQLNQMAKTEWSNSGAVSKAGALAGSIYNDPKIQNAVAGAAQYKKLLGDIDQAKSSGKGYSTQNEWDALKSVQGWLNNPEAGAQYSGGSYSPYVDVNKKAETILSKLHPEWQTETNPLVAMGSIGGITAYTMVQGKKEYISSKMVTDALQGQLEPEDWNQLGINGRYSGRVFNDPNQYANHLEGLKQDSLSGVDTKIAALRDAIQKNQNDQTVVQQLNGQLDQLTAAKENISKTYNGFKSQVANGDMEGVKSNLYTMNYLSSLGDSYGYTKEDVEYKESPLFKSYLDQKKEERDQNKYLLDMEKNKYEIQKLQAETDKLNRTTKAGGVLGSGDYTPSPVSTTDAHQMAIDFGTVTQQMGSNIEGEKYLALYDYTLNSQGQEKADEIFNHTRDANGNVIIRPKKGYEAQANMSYQQLQDKFDEDPNSVPDYMRSHFGQVSIDKQLYDARTAAFNKAQKQADQQVGSIDGYLKNFGNMRVGSSSGDLNYTPKELYDFNSKLSNLQYQQQAGDAGGPYYVDPAEANNSLKSDKERVLYRSYFNAVNGQGSQADNLIAAKLDDIKTKVNGVIAPLTAKRAEVVSKALEPYINYKQNYSESIPTGKTEEREAAGGLATRLYQNEVAGSGGRNNTLPSSSEFAKIRKDVNTTYSYYHTPEGKTSLRIQNDAYSDKPIDLEIDLGQQRQQGLNKYDATSPLKDLLALNTTPSGSSYTGNSLQTALPIQNPNFQQYNMKYTIGQNRDGSYTANFYIYDKQNKTWLYKNTPLNTSGWNSLEQITKAIQDPRFEQIISNQIKGTSTQTVANQSQDPRNLEQTGQ